MGSARLSVHRPLSTSRLLAVVLGRDWPGYALRVRIGESWSTEKVVAPLEHRNKMETLVTAQLGTARHSHLGCRFCRSVVVGSILITSWDVSDGLGPGLAHSHNPAESKCFLDHTQS